MKQQNKIEEIRDMQTQNQSLILNCTWVFEY